MSLISVIIPTLDAEDYLVRTLSALVPGVVEGLIKEVIVVDRGSTDSTLEVAESTGCRIVRSDSPCGLHLRLGCNEARGEWLLMLHPDSLLSPGWVEQVRSHIKSHPLRAGYFELRFDDLSGMARMWCELMSVRVRFLALPGVDYGLLLSRPLYDTTGGYRDQVAYEDVALSMKLGRARLRSLGTTVTTTFARFKVKGWMAAGFTRSLRFAFYLMGFPPKPPASPRRDAHRDDAV